MRVGMYVVELDCRTHVPVPRGPALCKQLRADIYCILPAAPSAAAAARRRLPPSSAPGVHFQPKPKRIARHPRIPSRRTGLRSPSFPVPCAGGKARATPHPPCFRCAGWRSGQVRTRVRMCTRSPGPPPARLARVASSIAPKRTTHAPSYPHLFRPSRAVGGVDAGWRLPGPVAHGCGGADPGIRRLAGPPGAFGRLHAAAASRRASTCAERASNLRGGLATICSLSPHHSRRRARAHHHLTQPPPLSDAPHSSSGFRRSRLRWRRARSRCGRKVRVCRLNMGVRGILVAGHGVHNSLCASPPTGHQQPAPGEPQRSHSPSNSLTHQLTKP